MIRKTIIAAVAAATPQEMAESAWHTCKSLGMEGNRQCLVGAFQPEE